MESWLKGHIAEKCPYCGSDMVEIINDNGKITNRQCSNIKECPGHNAAKVEDMMKILKIDGVGFKTALNMINTLGMKSHLEYLQLIPEDSKEMELSTALRLLCIEGVDKQFVSECEKNNVYDLEDLEKLPAKLRMILAAHEDELLYIMQIIKLKKPEVVHTNAQNCVVMITGPVNGYKSKEEFITDMNKRFGEHYKIIHQETKRKTKVDALIKEQGTATTGKTEAALSAGIPILTSKEFIGAMEELCKQ